ncbi:LacI family DNA-binding transcriptional regulator, partial [Candidatus Margulisiibacteriota bacterium]
MANLKDIAKKCGVAISTVSTALNHPHKISIEVREKIMAVANEIGYFRKKGELALKKVLIIADNYQNYFYGEYYQDVIFGVQQKLSEQKVAMLILSGFEIDYSEIY